MFVPYSAHSMIKFCCEKYGMKKFKVVAVCCVVVFIFCSVYGQDNHSVEEYFSQGEYEKALSIFEKNDNVDPMLGIELLKTLGHYERALTYWKKYAFVAGKADLFYEGVSLYRLTGRSEKLGELFLRLVAMVDIGNGGISASDLVIAGRLALDNGEDAGEVLNDYFEKAIKKDPMVKAAYLAIAKLAFSKDDMKTAGDALQKANQQFPNDLDILLGLVQVFESSNKAYSDSLLNKINEINPRHFLTLKYRLHRALKNEDHKKINELVNKIEKINTKDFQFLSLKACYALLNHNKSEADSLRSKALKIYKNNPEVDSFIGDFLSYKGRFKEANFFLNQALKIEKNHQKSRINLCLNLLRIGKMEEGFDLAEKISDEDSYNVTAYNLSELKDVFFNLTIIKNEHFSIRMPVNDAKIYGKDVEDFLLDAREKLADKYGFVIKEHVHVDFYSDSNDFAIRNFSYPLEIGALGVCFGNVITMKTVEAQREAHNWHEVLWHEYVHVLTLAMSAKNIPRWLTEGISVYEEWQGPVGWGHRMSLSFRSRILAGEIIPIREFNASFYSKDVHFAYYQSGLLVRYLVESKGFEKLKNFIEELSGGEKVLDLFEKYYGTVRDVDVAFAKYAKEKAAALAKDVDFTKFPKGFKTNELEMLDAFLVEHPHHYQALGLKAKLLSDKPEVTENIYLAMIQLYPEDVDTRDNPYEHLAAFYRQQKKQDKEKNILHQYCRYSAHKWRSLKRLVELSVQAKDWDAAKGYALRSLSVNPLQSSIYKTLASYYKKNNNTKKAVRYCEKALYCKDVTDKAGLHFMIAELLKEEDEDKAKQHILFCLEEAPRYREAYKLLLELTE